MATAVLSLLIKGLALSALTLVAVGALARLRGVSAAARHLVCALCLAGLLLLPVLSVGLPSLPVTISAAARETAPPPAAPTVRAARPAPDAAPRATTALAVPAPTAPAAAMSAPVNPRRVPWAPVALGAYAAGVLLALVAALRDLVAVGRLRRSCVPVTQGPAADAMAEAACRMRLRRPVSLLAGHGVPVPMTAGWLRPAVLLPADAGSWEPERLSVALLHEPAHVWRGDFAWQLVARLACALHWCDPLAWLLSRRMREEAERACDDRVLLAGLAPSAYAGHLVSIARGLTGAARPAATAAAVAMAGRSDLTGRVAAILRQGAHRSPAPVRRQIALLVLPSLGLLAAVAMLSPAEDPAASPRASAAERRQPASLYDTLPAQPAWRVDLGGGVSAELVAVGTGEFRETGKEPRSAWVPDGKPLELGARELALLGADGRRAAEGQRKFWVAFRITPAEGESLPIKFRFEGGAPEEVPGDAIGSEGREERKNFANRGGLRMVTVVAREAATEASVSVGVADGAWEDAGSLVPIPTRERGGMLEYSFAGGRTTARPLHPGRESFAFRIARDLRGLDWRVTVADRGGRTHVLAPYSVGTMSAGLPPVTTHTLVSHLPASLTGVEVREFRLEARPFRWVPVPGFALRTALTSAPEAPASAGAIRLPNGVEVGEPIVLRRGDDGLQIAWDRHGRSVTLPDAKHLLPGTDETGFLAPLRFPGMPARPLTAGEYSRRFEELQRATDIAFGVMEWGASRSGSELNGFETEKGRGVPAAFTSWKAPEGWRQADLFLSVAYGPWETALTAPPKGGAARELEGGETIRMAPVRRKTYRDPKGRPYGVTEVIVHLPQSMANPPGMPARYQYHLVAEHTGGASLGMYRSTQSTDAGTLSMNLLDQNLLPDRLKGWRLQVRPFHTTYFRGVPLQPK